MVKMGANKGLHPPEISSINGQSDVARNRFPLALRRPVQSTSRPIRVTPIASGWPGLVGKCS